MDSLSATLTPIDEINITCQFHETPAIGVCGNNLCKERKFFCMKCVKANECCITLSRHELVSLSELLYRFFIKQETKAIDLVEINNMMEVLKETDRMEITKNLSEFNSNLQMIIAKVVENSNMNIRKTIDIKKLALEPTSIYKIKSVLANALKEGKNIDTLTCQKIPQCLNDYNPQNVKDYLKCTNITKEEKDDCTKTVKLLADYESISKAISASDDIIHINQTVTFQGKLKLEEKIEKKLKEIEENFNKQLEDIEKTLIPNKENIVIAKSSINKFTSDPNKLAFKMDICESAHKSNSIDSVFCAFKSLKGDLYVVWGTPTFSVEVYDLKSQSIAKTITAAHTSTIFSCRHYVDKKLKRDLVITSSYDKSVKVWSVKDNWSNILTIPSAHSGYYIYSVCVLSDEYENKNFIISAAPNEFTKVWDFNGKFLRDFGVNSESTYFINCWLDQKTKKYYILNANSHDVKVYDFKTGLLFKSYKGTPQTWHMSAMVNEINNNYQLIESDGNGNIRIWDFYQGTLLKTISSSGINLRGISLWNDQYIFSAGSDYMVKLYDLKSGTFIKSLSGHTSTVCALDKIVHPKYGECLISHGLDGKLKLWVAK
jgi:WD40 repeat protein